MLNSQLTIATYEEQIMESFNKTIEDFENDEWREIFDDKESSDSFRNAVKNNFTDSQIPLLKEEIKKYDSFVKEVSDAMEEFLVLTGVTHGDEKMYVAVNDLDLFTLKTIVKTLKNNKEI